MRISQEFYLQVADEGLLPLGRCLGICKIGAVQIQAGQVPHLQGLTEHLQQNREIDFGQMKLPDGCKKALWLVFFYLGGN